MMLPRSPVVESVVQGLDVLGSVIRLRVEVQARRIASIADDLSGTPHIFHRVTEPVAHLKGYNSAQRHGSTFLAIDAGNGDANGPRRRREIDGCIAVNAHPNRQCPDPSCTSNS